MTTTPAMGDGRAMTEDAVILDVSGHPSNGPGVAAMDEQIIELYAHVTRTACLRMTPQHLAALQSSLDQTSCLSARLQWDRKATAHAEMFNLLADAVAEALPSSLLSSATGRVHDLMITVGPAADGIALNARRRLLALIRAGDADGAAEEVERHLRVLSFMGRLASAAPSACHGRRTGARRSRTVSD
jgi:DNA-binding FadR family transcriptional regulator